uniref:Uncharacterized protein n=1 Tax=Romanomermis culicivorax TaxID=13658 RepID=A0A915IHG7_ROMCU
MKEGSEFDVEVGSLIVKLIKGSRYRDPEKEQTSVEFLGLLVLGALIMNFIENWWRINGDGGDGGRTMRNGGGLDNHHESSRVNLRRLFTLCGMMQDVATRILVGAISGIAIMVMGIISFVVVMIILMMRFMCNSISDEERSALGEAYWGLGDWYHQKDYFSKFVNSPTIKGSTTENDSRQNGSKSYYFEKYGQRIRVCKTFFCNMLNISHEPIDFGSNNKENSIFTKQDGKGRHAPHNMMPEEDRERVHNHIKAVRKVDSHYF